MYEIIVDSIIELKDRGGKMKIGAAVLAGGKSTRMGQNKAMLKIGEVTAVEKILEELKGFDEIIISSDNYKILDKEVGIYGDIFKNCGPIGGIYTILKNCKSEAIFITACDMPMIKEDTVKKFCVFFDDRFDAMVLKHGKTMEPLFAVYKKSAAAYFEKAIMYKRYSLKEALSELNVKYVGTDMIKCDEIELINMNTPEDYMKVAEIYNENRS